MKNIIKIKTNTEQYMSDIINFYKLNHNGSMSPYWTLELLKKLSPTFYIILERNDIIAISATTTNYKELVEYWDETRTHVDDFKNQDKMTYFFFDIVHPKHQGKGLHRALIKHRIKETKGKSYCYIHKESFASLINYKRSGFSYSEGERKGTDYLALSNL